jgi:hypothetical protein
VIAVGHSLLVSIYHILKSKADYKELGGDYFDKINPKRLAPYLVKRLENLGYAVDLSPRQKAA